VRGFLGGSVGAVRRQARYAWRRRALARALGDLATASALADVVRRLPAGARPPVLEAAPGGVRVRFPVAAPVDPRPGVPDLFRSTADRRAALEDVIAVGLSAQDARSLVHLDLGAGPGVTLVEGPAEAAHALCCAMVVQVLAVRAETDVRRLDRDGVAVVSTSSVAWAGRAMPGLPSRPVAEVLDEVAVGRFPRTRVLVLSTCYQPDGEVRERTRQQVEVVLARRPEVLVLTTVDLGLPGWRLQLDEEGRLRAPDLEVDCWAGPLPEALAAVGVRRRAAAMCSGALLPTGDRPAVAPAGADLASPAVLPAHAEGPEPVAEAGAESPSDTHDPVGVLARPVDGSVSGPADTVVVERQAGAESPPDAAPTMVESRSGARTPEPAAGSEPSVRDRGQGRAR
jgi:hypothetical protein